VRIQSAGVAVLLVAQALGCNPPERAPTDRPTTVPATAVASAQTEPSASPVPKAPEAPSSPAPSADRCHPPAEGAEAIRSSDGHIVVYVQTDPKRHDDTTLEPAEHKDLCVIAGTSPPRLLVEGRPSLPDGGAETTLAAFSALRFSADEKRVFFSSTAWVVSPALHEVDVATGTERFLTDGALDTELVSGPHKGDLVVTHYLLDPDHDISSPKYRGRMLLWYRHDRTGKRLERLPDDEAARRKVLDEG
jgi:hypothetical protein